MIPETEPVDTALVPEEDDRRAMSAIKICGTLANNGFVAAAAVVTPATGVVALLPCVAAIIAIASFIARCLSAALNPAYSDWLGSLLFLLARRVRDFSSHV